MISLHIKEALMEMAVEKSGVNITPCGRSNIFQFSEMGEFIVLWYNTPDNSTHTVKLKTEELCQN